eukprot:TRINITY_DN1940_c0_g1_i1.p1 TRINITY_DN1940_c0_g1~~TRINITY_DN1940_c0_g1_i1.p1  ORF type:complete len:953 (-),score=103.81 TRINITY_DN1940_c0_g1_i1:1934-4792(-)
MAVSGRAFAISFVVNFCVGLVCFVSFNILRVHKFSRKYYAPKRILKIEDRTKPKRLPNGFISWMRPLFQYKEEELIDTAGMDAVINFRLISFGLWLFLILTILCNITILPTNLSGDFIDRVLRGEIEGANFTTSGTEEDKTEGQEADFKGCDIDSAISGTFSDIDRTSLTNIQLGGNKMWVHLILVYVVSIIVYNMLTKYHKHAVSLRLQYLSRLKRGAESHTVFVTDIPGIQSGTQLDRAYQLINGTAGRFVPQKWKDKLEQAVTAATERTVGQIQKALVTSQHGQGTIEEEVVDVNSTYKSAHSDFLSDSSKKKIEIGELSSPKSVGSVSTPHSTVQEITDMHPWRKVENKLKSGMDIRDVVFYEFNEVFPSQVQNAFPVYNQNKLWGLYLAYEKTKQLIVDNVDHLTSLVRRRKKVKRPQGQIIPAIYGDWCVEKYKDKNDPTGIKPVKVDLLDFWQTYLPKLMQQIDEEKQIALKNYTSSAFVTFKSRTLQVVSATSLHHHDETVWRTEAAPAPDDLIWENLKLRNWETSYRTAVSWGFFILLMMVYAIPVAAIQAFIEQLLNPDEISNEFLRSVLAGLLPGLALKIFLILVPIILAQLNYREGLIANSFIDFEVVRKYFIFQVLVVYLYAIGFSSLWKEIECIRKDPSNIVDKLASGVPQNATYFMTYIVLLGLASKPISFLRLPGLVIYWVLSKLAATERAKNRLWQEQTMLYGPEIPEHTITILIGLCFCCVQPLIAPICLLYFVSATIISRYQLVYVYREKFQSGGRMWPICFDQIFISLVIMQLTMLGLLGMKQFRYAPLLLPLILYNLVYYISMDRLYRRPLTVMSLRAATDIDAHDEEIDGPIDQEYNQEVMQRYLSPCFKVSQDECKNLMEEMEKLEHRLSNVGKGKYETQLAEKEQEEQTVEVSDDGALSDEGTSGRPEQQREIDEEKGEKREEQQKSK